MHRTSLAFAVLLVLCACFVLPVVAVPTIDREVESSDEEVTITFTVDAEPPFAFGIVESVPEEWEFAETDSEISTAPYFEVDRDGRKIAFFVCDENKVSYTLTGTGDGGDDFVTQWVDLCELTPNQTEADEALAVELDSLPLGVDEKLTGDLVGSSVCGYMLGTNDLTLDEVSDAAYVYAVWGGEPKTVTDMIGRTVTLYRPSERIICTGPDNSRMVIALGDGNLLVGADGMTVGYGCVCPMTGDREILCEECWESVVPGGLNNLPEISTSSYETMLMVKPDLIILWGSDEGQADDMEDRMGVPVFAANPEVQPAFAYQTMIAGHARAVGAVLSREQEAEDLIEFTDSKVKLVTDITDTIPESEKPRVYFALFGAGNGFYDPKSGRDFTCTTNNYYPLTMAGGINVARDIFEDKVCGVNVALEQIIAWNPDAIIISAFSEPGNGGAEFILNAPDLQSVKAVQEGRVYTIFSPYCRGAPHDKNLLNVLYIAKVLYPDKFADLDMEKEGNEIMAAFLGVDGVYTAYADYQEFPSEQQI